MSAAPDMPSEGTIADQIDEYLPNFGGSLEAARAILALIRPAFEAKERGLREAVLHVAEWAARAGEAEGRLKMSEAAGIVEGWRLRALSAEAKLAQAVEAGEICRRARAFDDDEVDIRIEVDRGFYVITRERGCIRSSHTDDAGKLPALVRGLIEDIRRARAAAAMGEKT